MIKSTIMLGLVLLSVTGIAQDKIETQHALKNPANAYIYDLITSAKGKSKTDTAAANVLFRNAIALAKEKGDDYAAGSAYFELAEMNSRYANHNRTFGGYVNARPFFEKAGAQKELAYTLFGLGREQYYRGAFNYAATHINYAILYAQQNNLKKLEADALEYLALLYQEVTYYDKQSNPYLFRSLEIKKMLNDMKGMAMLLPKISRGYYLEKKYDSALYYADETIRISSKFNIAEVISNARLTRAEILLRLNKPAAAADELERAWKSQPETPERNFLIHYYTVSGNVLLATSNEAAAALQYDTAISLAKKTVTPEGLAMVYNKLSEAYAGIKNYPRAYYYQKEFNNLYINLYTKENIGRYEQSEFLISKRLSDDQVKYLDAQNQLKQVKLRQEIALRNVLQSENMLKDALLIKQKQLNDAIARENIVKSLQLNNEQQVRSTLKNANALQQDKLDNEKKMRLALITGLLLAAILSAVIFGQYHRQKRKNIIIQQQSEDLKTLMKEVHHRVKNNLQVISSLLDLQSHTIKDEQASEAVKEGRNRVQSMALLHQNLYSEGNIKGIRVKGYINSLAQGLFNSYNIDAGKITISADIDDLNLDVDTVIPLGLVLNELISNSLKHAFRHSRTGVIRLQLKQRESGLLLKVADNGVGFPERFDTASGESFGMKLIRAFSKKLKAKLEIYNDNGAVVEMQITRYKMAET